MELTRIPADLWDEVRVKGNCLLQTLFDGPDHNAPEFRLALDDALAACKAAYAHQVLSGIAANNTTGNADDASLRANDGHDDFEDVMVALCGIEIVMAMVAHSRPETKHDSQVFEEDIRPVHALFVCVSNVVMMMHRTKKPFCGGKASDRLLELAIQLVRVACGDERSGAPMRASKIITDMALYFVVPVVLQLHLGSGGHDVSCLQILFHMERHLSAANKMAKTDEVGQKLCEESSSSASVLELITQHSTFLKTILTTCARIVENTAAPQWQVDIVVGLITEMVRNHTLIVLAELAAADADNESSSFCLFDRLLQAALSNIMLSANRRKALLSLVHRCVSAAFASWGQKTEEEDDSDEEAADGNDEVATELLTLIKCAFMQVLLTREDLLLQQVSDDPLVSEPQSVRVAMQLGSMILHYGNQTVNNLSVDRLMDSAWAWLKFSADSVRWGCRSGSSRPNVFAGAYVIVVEALGLLTTLNKKDSDVPRITTELLRLVDACWYDIRIRGTPSESHVLLVSGIFMRVSPSTQTSLFRHNEEFAKVFACTMVDAESSFLASRMLLAMSVEKMGEAGTGRRKGTDVFTLVGRHFSRVMTSEDAHLSDVQSPQFFVNVNLIRCLAMLCDQHTFCKIVGCTRLWAGVRRVLDDRKTLPNDILWSSCVMLIRNVADVANSSKFGAFPGCGLAEFVCMLSIVLPAASSSRDQQQVPTADELLKQLQEFTQCQGVQAELHLDAVMLQSLDAFTETG